MKRILTIATLIIFCLGAKECLAQAFPKGKKKKELATICPFSYHKKVISHGIGARMGDPFGLTYKIYYKRRIAVELIGGYGFSALYSNVHREKFNVLPQFDSANYIAHEVDFSTTFQGRVILHNNFPTHSHLDWYVGAGYYIRWFRVNYVFSAPNEDGNSDIGSAFFSDIDLGPEGIAGFEFDYPNIPITVFAEASFVFNIGNNSSFNRLLGGLGIRYDF